MGRITIVGLGPARSDLVTASSLQVLQAGKPVYLRTARHPSAAVVLEEVAGAMTFDDVYEAADSIEAVYAEIVERLVAASGSSDIVYAVPGSPLVAETTVDLLRADSRVTVDIVPAMSFLDLAWHRLGVDPLAVSPRIVDAHRFVLDAAAQTAPLLVAQCDSQNTLSAVKLAFEKETPARAIVLQRLGLPDESVREVKWEDLDREIVADHLTSLWISEIGTPVAPEMARLEEVARTLRERCPWDKEQTHESLARYAVEEAYELVDAIEARAGDGAEGGSDVSNDDHLIEELGDVLFQAFAHAAIAAEEGRFNIADVADAISTKLIERHPHVYGDVVANTAEDVKVTWEANKKQSKGRKSIMEGIPRQLPALMYATKVLKKARVEGYELTDEMLDDTGLGGALMLLVDEARKRDVDPEAELRRVTDRFRTSFEDSQLGS